MKGQNELNHKSENVLDKKETILTKDVKYQKIISKSKPNLLSSSLSKEFIFKLFKYKYFILFILLSLLYSVYSMPPKLEASYKKIEKFLKFNLAGNLPHSTSKFYYRENPEISIVISTFNGEVYLKTAVRSIQNQNFLNIEIKIVDDGSMDKTVEVVKELMKEDRRIKLLSNSINKGTLFTKTRGVLNAKGKYVMTLDQDNLFASKEVFYKLYRDAEQYNLDLLGCSAIVTRIEIKDIPKNHLRNYFKTKIIKKPCIKKRFLGFDKKEKSETFLFMYFIKTKLFINSIKKLGDEFINRNIDAHDDTILSLFYQEIHKN